LSDFFFLHNSFLKVGNPLGWVESILPALATDDPDPVWTFVPWFEANYVDVTVYSITLWVEAISCLQGLEFDYCAS